MALAQFERELTAERTKLNLHARALRGLCNGGSPILGYDKDPKNHGYRMINPNEAIIVKDIFDAFEDTGSITKAIKIIHDKGHRTKIYKPSNGNTRGGRKFAKQSFHNTLTNHAYIGRREVNLKNKGKINPKLEDQYKIVKAQWKPIISEEQFNRVRDILQEGRKKYIPAMNAKRDYFLSGILQCGECESPFIGTTAHGRSDSYFYYRHHPKSKCSTQYFNAEEMNKLVLKKLKNLYKDKNLLSALIKKANEESIADQEDIKSSIASTENRSRNTKQKIKNLVRILSENPTLKNKKSILDSIGEMETEATAVEDEKESLSVKLHHLKSNAISKKTVRNIIHLYLNDIKKMSVFNKKQAIQYIVEKIVISPDNKIIFQYRGWPETDLMDSGSSEVCGPTMDSGSRSVKKWVGDGS